MSWLGTRSVAPCMVRQMRIVLPKRRCLVGGLSFVKGGLGVEKKGLGYVDMLLINVFENCRNYKRRKSFHETRRSPKLIHEWVLYHRERQ